MKTIIGLVAGTFLATSAFGFNISDLPGGSFVGAGTWKMPNGDTGRYTETLEIEKTEAGVELHTVTTVYHEGSEEVMTVDYILTDVGNGFFTVAGTSEQGESVGEGYCFEKTCHWSNTEPNGKSEETFHFHRGRVMKIGSASGTTPEGDWSVAWRGQMRRAN